jgi:dihydroflavonol-4-reductase
VKVAVTGGTGVVGRPVVLHLVESGHQVTALARNEASAERLRDAGVTTVLGDILDRDSLRSLVEGVERVFHVAGINEMCSKDPGRMDRVNIEGTRNVLIACRSAGVRRLIHTSSAVTIGQPHGVVATEATTHRGSYLSRYERSKHLSERAVLEEAGELEVVAVNPSSVQGPGRATGTGKLFLDAARGSLPFVIDATFSIVDVDDCARGHLLAADHGRPGERYILSGATLDVTQAVVLLGDITGQQLRPRFLPGWSAWAAAGLIEAGSRLLGRNPVVCRESVRVARAGHAYDGSRAIRELGLSYTPVEDTIRRTVDWFRSQGLLT